MGEGIGALIRKVERLALAAVLAYAAIYTHLYNRERESRELGEIAARGLPKDVLAKYTLENRRLVQLVRDMDGKVRAIARYVPAEGSVEVITRRQEEALRRYNELLDRLKQAKTPEEAKKIEEDLRRASEDANKPPEVVVKDWGFTSRFGAGVVVSPGNRLDLVTAAGNRLSLPASPALDWKWFYWKRWSTELQVSMFYVGPSVSRHVDDFMPRWLHADNVELAVGGGPCWRGGRCIGAGFRSNF